MWCYKKLRSLLFDCSIPFLCLLTVFMTLQCIEVLKLKIASRYETSEDFIFIGGVPRSGTTLMRALLDAHDEIRCGEETRVIPELLQMRQRWEAMGHMKLLNSAGVTHQVLRNAISKFIAEIIKTHGSKARRFCDKDPLIMSSMKYLNEMFPRAKFILMIRDGRATVHSMIKRRVPVVGFSMKKPEESLKEWSRLISVMYNQCIELGRKYCLPVYYESLVLNSRAEMERVLNFLGIPWSEKVLHHEAFIGDDIRLSPLEFSTSQVRKAINLKALKTWKEFYPKEVLEKMPSLAPMLTRLGYNATDDDPDYRNLRIRY